MFKTPAWFPSSSYPTVSLVDGPSKLPSATTEAGNGALDTGNRKPQKGQQPDNTGTRDVGLQTVEVETLRSSVWDALEERGNYTDRRVSCLWYEVRQAQPTMKGGGAPHEFLIIQHLNMIKYVTTSLLDVFFVVLGSSADLDQLTVLLPRGISLFAQQQSVTKPQRKHGGNFATLLESESLKNQRIASNSLLKLRL